MPLMCARREDVDVYFLKGGCLNLYAYPFSLLPILNLAHGDWGLLMVFVQHQTKCHDPIAAVRKDRGEKIVRI